jgi:molecular chaperone DnaK (HSP70)
VLIISGDRFEVVGTGGDNFLGGLDFDQRIVTPLREAMVRQGGPESPTPQILERLLAEAEKLKIALSGASHVQVRIEHLWQDEGGRWRDLELEVRRESLEGWVDPLVERSIDLVEAVLRDHGLHPDQIDDLILVGAQSRMPLIRRRLEERLGVSVRDDADPEQAVALGCAMVARGIQQAADPRTAPVNLEDVLALTIALGLPDGRLAPVIERGTRIPCQRTVRITTQEDEQRALEVVLFQGNARRAEHAEYLGTLTFQDLPPAPAGEVELVLVFSLDEEGLLTVTGTEERSGQEIRRVLSTVETPEEVQATLARSATVIRDLATLLPEGPEEGRESSGLFRGLKKLFGGGP